MGGGASTQVQGIITTEVLCQLSAVCPGLVRLWEKFGGGRHFKKSSLKAIVPHPLPCFRPSSQMQCAKPSDCSDITEKDARAEVSGRRFRSMLNETLSLSPQICKTHFWFQVIRLRKLLHDNADNAAEEVRK